ncbi:hypothetical protein Nepgr_002835 [Nepenthes gracilis]|uniref:Uncharacterized protein n=1 Tax=Nepenthes gracilis TaxID=150966 RepID=A0AAD3RYH7_NEPGR|nr:hypothetical protein Nepgr_002835 [Nepenthes gracilis]
MARVEKEKTEVDGVEAEVDDDKEMAELFFTSLAEVVGDAGGATVFMQLLCQLLLISCQNLIQLVLESVFCCVSLESMVLCFVAHAAVHL